MTEDKAPDAEADPDRPMTVAEAAAWLGIGRNQVYGAISRGELPHLRIGRTIRLFKSAIVRYASRDRVELPRH